MSDLWPCRFCGGLQEPPKDYRAAWERQSPPGGTPSRPPLEDRVHKEPGRLISSTPIPGAASRSEQGALCGYAVAPHTNCILPAGHIGYHNVVSAAEAAPSPQVGAAPAGESEGLGLPPPPRRVVDIRKAALEEAAGLARQKARGLRRKLNDDPEYDPGKDEGYPEEFHISALYRIADEIEALAKPPDAPEDDIAF